MKTLLSLLFRRRAAWLLAVRHASFSDPVQRLREAGLL